MFETGRWPSIWDADDLGKTIKEIVSAPGADFEAKFYMRGDHIARGGPACQGDVVELRGPAPFIDADGQAVVTDAEFDRWLILGNTCDVHRSHEETPWSDLARLRRYEYAKKFYVPPWPGGAGSHHVADFMNPVTIDKRAFRDDCARVVARLDFGAWALLHACIVRFLARSDGRLD